MQRSLHVCPDDPARFLVQTADPSAGCLILHGGSDLFHGSTIRTVEYVFGQGNLTVDHLRNFADSLAAAKDITINQIFLPADVQQKIDVVEEKLNSSAGVFSTRLQENSRKIKGVLNHMCVWMDGSFDTICYFAMDFPGLSKIIRLRGAFLITVVKNVLSFC